MDYQLKSLGKTCTATGQPLAPGSVCHSVVVERDGAFVRLDYSPAAWQGPPPNAIGHWTMQVPQPKQAQRVDPDALLRYFEQLCEEASPVHDTSRFVAALLLLKLRRLKLDDIRRDEDGEFLQLSGLRGEGAIEVRHLKLPDDELSHLQQELKAHLVAEWTT